MGWVGSRLGQQLGFTSHTLGTKTCSLLLPHSCKYSFHIRRKLVFELSRRNIVSANWKVCRLLWKVLSLWRESGVTKNKGKVWVLQRFSIAFLWEEQLSLLHLAHNPWGLTSLPLSLHHLIHYQNWLDLWAISYCALFGVPRLSQAPPARAVLPASWFVAPVHAVLVQCILRTINGGILSKYKLVCVIHCPYFIFMKTLLSSRCVLNL